MPDSLDEAGPEGEKLKMRKGNLNREQAIEATSLEHVEALESMNCEPTNRLQTDGDDAVEFVSSVDFIDQDGENRTLTAYYYQDQDVLDEIEDGDLGVLDWEINGYEIW